jgi:Cytochrome c554 and c-prime
MSGSPVRQIPAGPDRRSPDAASSARPATVIVALGMVTVVAAALWVLFAATGTSRLRGRVRGVQLLTIDRPFPAGGRFVSDPYIGSKVCAECHPGEAALHSRSGHASTLRPAGRGSLARRLDRKTVADPEHPDVVWSYRYRAGELSIARKTRDKVEECIAEYAFGSGHHATTFVNVIDPKTPAILEHRMTYYTSAGTLDITPGHISNPPLPGVTPHGFVLTPENSLRCFHCHTTAISARDEQRIDEATMIPNVSCERCPGPGRAHVTAARRGAPESELSLPFGPDRWNADELMKMCGACHRHPSEAGTFVIRPEEIHLARFQPVGIMQSRCFQESNGAFSCVTCHDPHARAAADRAGYDPTCLTCHSGRGLTPAPLVPAAQRVDRASAAGKPCPVSPGSRCVECHMPRVDAGQFVLFSDHWIRVRRPAESSSRTDGPVLVPKRDLHDPPRP